MLDDLRTLDILLAEKLFGYAVTDDGYYVGDDGEAIPIEKYSADYALAFEVLRELYKRGFSWTARNYNGDDVNVVIYPSSDPGEYTRRVSAFAPFPLAVARAAISALDSEGK